jgi:hypothetical protein
VVPVELVVEVEVGPPVVVLVAPVVLADVPVPVLDEAALELLLCVPEVPMVPVTG